jgi:hypothetical protein
MAPQSTARVTRGLSGWIRSSLPDVVIDPPDEERGRRDRVVDATMYLVAFAISAATLVDTWELHPPWLRPVAVVGVIATVGALRWRRTHPAAVGIGVAAVSVLLTTAPFVALFNAAIRARGPALAITAGLTLVSCFTNPMLYRGPQSLELEFGAGLGFAGAALVELRGVIGVLREDVDESLTGPPQPTLADLPALVEESRAAGMRITARIELGDAAPAAAVGRTAYRIAQEGLTNARKHAPGAAVTLTVDAPDGDLRVQVRSLAPVGVASGPPLPGAGTGLIGLAERVTLAGGELEHGVDPDGAFVLRARLPR